MQEVNEKFYLVSVAEFKAKMGLTEDVLIVMHQGGDKPLKIYVKSEIVDPTQKKLSVAETIDKEVKNNDEKN